MPTWSDSLVLSPAPALQFKRKSFSRLAVAGGIAVSLLLCSCKEQEALLKEQADAQAALTQAKIDLEAYQSKINSAGQAIHLASAALENQIAASDKASAELTQAVSDLNKQAAQLDEALKTLRPKVDAYKAKYLR